MNSSIISAIEKLLLISEYHDDVQQLSLDVAEISGQIQTILVVVESAIRNIGNDPAVRADLEEIRQAAVRAIMKVEPLSSG
ncbi:MAG TPA: hypothetical protein VL326_10180, partial [Kofleriaceae bacterium]|nr:hypothetical protein [Kofleriaceae bacterium]